MHILAYKWNSLTWMLPAVTFSVALAEQAFADHWCWLPGHGKCFMEALCYARPQAPWEANGPISHRESGQRH